MAKTNEYLNEAYHTLLHLSEDEEKRLEYKTREKALKDYNTQMGSAERRGIEKGIEKGIEAIIIDNIEEKRTEEEIPGKLQKWFSLSKESAKQYFDRVTTDYKKINKIS